MLGLFSLACFLLIDIVNLFSREAKAPAPPVPARVTTPAGARFPFAEMP